MAKHCLRCAYTTPDVWADECPFCLVTLARTREGGPAPVRSFRSLPVKLLIPLGLFLGAIILVNTRSFFDPLVALLESAVREPFMDHRHRQMWQVVEEPEQVFASIASAPGWSEDARTFAAI